jgi:hypothetical protein
MKYRSQYDLFDPEVVVEPPEAQAAVDPNAPDDAYTIGEHGNTVKAPDANARGKSDDAPKPWVRPLAVALAVGFVALTGWNVERAMQGPPPPPKPNAVQIKQTLYMGVMRIDAYRQVHNATPERISDAGLPENVGYTYQRIDAWHYVLGFENRGPRLDYDSTIPKESFFGSPQALLSMGGTQ